jgi:hypothetical protein
MSPIHKCRLQGGKNPKQDVERQEVIELVERLMVIMLQALRMACS